MRFVFEQRVPADQAAVFAFFANPRSLDVLHRDDGAFRLLHHSDSVVPGSMTWVECRVARGLPVVLGFRHDGWDPPHWFSEQLVHGPFERFAHRHEFGPVAGGTLVRDVLEIADTAAHVALPTAIVYAPVAVPDVLRWTLMVMAAGVFASGALDAVAWWRLRGRGAALEGATR